MYRRILLAYNGTTYATVALRQGAELARLCGAELHLVGIVATTGGFAIAQAAGPQDVWGLEQQHLRKALEAAAQEIAGKCVHLVSVIREGDPASEIVAYANEIKADIVVIGHRDRSVMARWLGGSTSQRLIQELRCSILIAEGE
ncbi:MAG: universal stress protein [Sphingomonadales bacterium]|nr:universal stress protein [Sphingomonadales bacterium]